MPQNGSFSHSGAKEIGFDCSDYGRMPTVRIAEKYREELAKFVGAALR